MTLVLMLFTAATAWAQSNDKDNIQYVDADGIQHEFANVTILRGGVYEEELYSDSTYAVTDSVSYEKIRFHESASPYWDHGVILILADGASLNISEFIIDGDFNFTIYGQAKGSGSINFTSNSEIDAES